MFPKKIKIALALVLGVLIFFIVKCATSDDDNADGKSGEMSNANSEPPKKAEYKKAAGVTYEEHAETVYVSSTSEYSIAGIDADREYYYHRIGFTIMPWKSYDSEIGTLSGIRFHTRYYNPNDKVLTYKTANGLDDFQLSRAGAEELIRFLEDFRKLKIGEFDDAVDEYILTGRFKTMRFRKSQKNHKIEMGKGDFYTFNPESYQKLIDGIREAIESYDKLMEAEPAVIIK